MDVFIVVWAFVNAAVSVYLYYQRQADDARAQAGLKQIDENMRLVNTIRAVEAGLVTVQPEGEGLLVRKARPPCAERLAASRN
jgi:hypothetical protein